MYIYIFLTRNLRNNPGVDAVFFFFFFRLASFNSELEKPKRFRILIIGRMHAWESCLQKGN